MVEAIHDVRAQVRGGVGRPAEVLDLRPPVRGERDDRASTEPEEPEEDRDEGRAVGQLQHHGVTVPDPRLLESGGHDVRPQVELAIGPPVVAGDDRRVVGGASRPSAQLLAERPARPPPDLAVVARDVVGPSDEVRCRAHDGGPGRVIWDHERAPFVGFA